MQSDAELLRQYAETGEENAFSQLVSRHANLVYSAALRHINSPDLARDITQTVFLDLANKAQSLASKLHADSSVVGWLYRATRFEALDLQRQRLRRDSRERKAMACLSDSANPTTCDWEAISSCLDDAMAELGTVDREAILLRFFKNESLRAVGLAFGVSEDAAQKRISRALEKLRLILSRRANPIAAGTLGVLISAHAVQAAPAGLVTEISSSIVLTAAGKSVAAIASTKTIFMTTMQKTLMAAAAAIALTAGFYQAHQNSDLASQVNAFRTAQLETAAELEKAKNQNTQLAAKLAQAESLAESPRPETPSSEVLKLRGTANLNAREIAQLREALSTRAERLPESVATLMNSYLTSLRTGEKDFQDADALSTMSKLSVRLSLTAEQQQQLRNILSSNVDARTELEVAAETGSLSFEEVRKRRNKLSAEEEKAITALLSPDQLASWQQMQTEEENPGIKSWANREANRLGESLNLTPEQRQQLAAVLNQLPPGQGGARMALYANAADQLPLRLAALKPLLTEQQLQRYSRMLQQDIDEHTLLARITRAMDNNQ